jgi:hypothetical protein
MSAREKHCINLVAVRAINKEVISFKSLLQNNLGLIMASEDNLVATNTATFPTTIPNEANQVLA